MITYIKIDGFKSFRNFEMNFTPFTVIAGANASGKSNLFDALQLLSDLASLPINDAFRQQRGNGLELFTQYGDNVWADRMNFIVEMLVPARINDSWGGQADLSYTRLRYELEIGRGVEKSEPYELKIISESLLPIKQKSDKWVTQVIPKQFRENWIRNAPYKGRYRPYIETVEQDGVMIIRTAQDNNSGEGIKAPAHLINRTVLSGNDSVRYAHALAARNEIRSWRFLDLNTRDLRQPTQKVAGFSDVITAAGKNLAAALYRIQKKDSTLLNDLSRDMANLIAGVTHVGVRDDDANNQYLIELRSNGRTYSSRVLSEGTLRLLALSVFRYDELHEGLLCYEEPENGIHPGRISALVKTLAALSVNFEDTKAPIRQIIVNTHSPILVAEVTKLQNTEAASVWFTQSASTFIDHEGQRHQLKITKILPVVTKNRRGRPGRFKGFSTNDNLRRLTLRQAQEYLTTTDLPANKFSL